MKLLRWGPKGEERPGLIDAEGVVRDLSDHADDIAGDVLSPDGLARLGALATERLPVVPKGTRLGPPVGRIGKVVCIGLNFADHAAEAGMDLPDEPIIFMKAVSAINGPHDAIEIPPGARRTDWEVELGIVIGQHAKNVSEDDALDHVTGFCIGNDVSERSFQLDHAGQWTKGKSADTFCPLGPWLVTRDALGDTSDLAMWTEVNGERVQDGSTRTMIFGPAFIVSYVSRFMSLHPGDVILTGTPPGVGMGHRPPRYLSPGDRLAIGIDGLGLQEMDVVQG